MSSVEWVCLSCVAPWEMGRVIKKLPEADQLGACKGQHFSKGSLLELINEQFFSRP